MSLLERCVGKEWVTGHGCVQVSFADMILFELTEQLRQLGPGRWGDLVVVGEGQECVSFHRVPYSTADG